MVDPNMAMAMATELPQTPPKQLAPKFTPADIPGAAIAVANAPVTPGPSTSTTTDATATATAITPVISPETPSSQASTSTDRSILATPGGTTPACSIIMSEYKVKTVRTAKCTECDKRNTSKMLACPGCTFQLCEGCVTRRMADQRGMVHGQVDTSLSPPMERVVRRRTVWSKDPATPATPKSEGNDAGEAAGGNEDGVASESSGGKGKQKAEGVSSSTKRKQAARKKAQKGDETNLEGDDFMHESPVPNASKRRRTNVPGPAFPLPSDELPSGQPVVRRRYKITPTKKNAAPVPDGPLSPRSGGPLKTIPPGVNLKEISAAEHLDMMGIKQDEPLLGRQMPVFYHTPMRIPGKLLKYNKPSSPAGSQVGEKSSSLATEEKNNEAKMLQAKQVRQQSSDQESLSPLN